MGSDPAQSVVDAHGESHDVRRLFVGPEVEGVFTLFAILFVFLGILILAVGLVGEYIGRIYLEVRQRPAYRVRAVHRQDPR